MWYQNHENLINLANWIDLNDGFDQPSDVIGFFEKPWKYESEWKEYDEQRVTV